jgi:hypothetical protein
MLVFSDRVLSRHLRPPCLRRNRARSRRPRPAQSLGTERVKSTHGPDVGATIGWRRPTASNFQAERLPMPLAIERRELVHDRAARGGDEFFGRIARGSQLSYLRFQTAGITGTNRPCQAIFSTASRTSFAGRITRPFSQLPVVLVSRGGSTSSSSTEIDLSGIGGQATGYNR